MVLLSHPYLMTTGKTITLSMTYNYSMIQQLYFGYISKGTEIRISKIYLHFHGHCKIFTIYKTWKQPKCPLPDELINTWYIHTQEYCCWLVTKSCPTLWNPQDCSMPGFPVLHCLLEFAHTHIHWLGDTIQQSHPLSPPSPPALNLSQHQGHFQRAGSLYQVARALELWLQHQSFQRLFRVDFL